MPVPALKVPAQVRDLIRRLPPELKRKIRAALSDILKDPGSGKALKEDLEGYWSMRVGKNRVIYRPDKDGVEVAAVGPRQTIYEEAARQILRDRKKG